MGSWLWFASPLLSNTMFADSPSPFLSPLFTCSMCPLSTEIRLLPLVFLFLFMFHVYVCMMVSIPPFNLSLSLKKEIYKKISIFSKPFALSRSTCRCLVAAFKHSHPKWPIFFSQLITFQLLTTSSNSRSYTCRAFLTQGSLSFPRPLTKDIYSGSGVSGSSTSIWQYTG